jgi:hypothetical protein
VETDKRYDADAWTDVVMEWAAQKPTVTMAEVLGIPLNLPKADWSKPNQMRVGGIMKKAGWEKIRDGVKTTDGITGELTQAMRYYNPNPPPIKSEGDNKVVELHPANKGTGGRGPLAGLID